MRKGVAGRTRAVRWGLGAALLLFVIGLSCNPSTANDLFWQLRVGQDILTTHHLPQYDTFSWTRHGAPCVMHEWLAFLLFTKAYNVSGGFAGVWLLQVGLLMGTFGALYKILLWETDDAPLTAFSLAIVAAMASSAFFQPRPHLLTYLLVTVTVGVVGRVRCRPEEGKRLWCLPPLYILWANLHAGVLLGIFLLILFVAGDSLDAYRLHSQQGPSWQEKKRTVKRLIALTLVCSMATLVNPYGWKIYHNFVMTISNATAMNAVTEWFSPDFHQASGKFLAMIALPVFAGLACSRQKRDTATVLITMALLYAALTAYRNVPLFALVGVLMSARHVHSALTRLTPQQSDRESSLFGKSPDARLVPVLLVLFGALAFLRCAQCTNVLPNDTIGRVEAIAQASIALHAFPERACRFLENEHFPVTLHLFNNYNYGGYLIWRLPQYPVFVDGRADVYFGKLLEDCVKIHDRKPDWSHILSSYPVDVAIVAQQSPEARLLRSSQEWALVYSDPVEPAMSQEEKALIFVRSSPKNQALIARCRNDCHKPLWSLRGMDVKQRESTKKSVGMAGG